MRSTFAELLEDLRYTMT